MARNAPRSGKTRLDVSEHAILRIRERAEVSPTLSDVDVAYALDDAVARAREEGVATAEVLAADGRAAAALRIDPEFDRLLMRSDGPIFALLRGNSVVSVAGEDVFDRGRDRARARPDPPLVARPTREEPMPEKGPKPLITSERFAVIDLLAPGEPRIVAVDVAREEVLEHLQVDPRLAVYRRVAVRVRVELEG